jgi:hypothetical protein
MDQSEPQATASPTTSGDQLLRTIVALACFGAAAVHLAFAAPHFGDGAGPGTYFLTLAWLQIACGVLLLTRTRRAFFALAFIVNAAAMIIWIVARASDAGDMVEPVGFAEALAVILQCAVLIGIPLLLTAPAARMSLGSKGTKAWIAASVVAIVALLSASVTFALPERVKVREVTRVVRKVMHMYHGDDGASVAGHAAGHDAHATDSTDAVVAASGHGHKATAESASSDETTASGHSGHTSASEATGTTAAAHDHDSGTTVGSTAAHNHTDPTTATTAPHNHGGGGGESDWEVQRRAALLGYLDPTTRDTRLASIGTYLAGQIRRYSGFIRSLPRAEADRRINAYLQWLLEHALDSAHGAEGGNHTDGPQVWQMTDPATSAQLQSQLKQAATIGTRYPTAAAAMAGGYFQVTPWMWGIGAHYLNISYIASFDPAHPAMLLYNGNAPSSELVGASYAVLGAQAPAGFAGPNDPWHTHPALCIVGGVFVVGADNVPADVCNSVGGVKSNGFGGTPFWMMHLWQVPGWEPGWGLFSPENPSINLATTDIR